MKDEMLFKRRRKSSPLATALVFRRPPPRPSCYKATISPGHTPDNALDINSFRSDYGHLDDSSVFDTVSQLVSP